MADFAPAAEGNKSSTKYTRLHECWTAVHNNQTMALEYHPSGTAPTDDIPAFFLHNQFSRFVLCLIDNSGNERKIMRVNIRACEVADLIESYWLAKQAKFNWKMSGAKETTGTPSLSPAYTVRIRAGDMKGKTPADVLLEDPSKKGELLRHKSWLTSFLSKYPQNQEVISAIDAAIDLLEEGELTPVEMTTSTSTTIDVWREDFKVMSNGSGSTRTNAKVHITCDFSSNNPWSFRLENSEHPLVNGSVDWNVVNNRRYGTMRLNDKEMSGFTSAIKSLTKYFEQHEFPKALDFVQRNSWHNTRK